MAVHVLDPDPRHPHQGPADPDPDPNPYQFQPTVKLSYIFFQKISIHCTVPRRLFIPALQ